jgi:predicted metal-dependent phosphoesterase TrpH
MNQIAQVRLDRVGALQWILLMMGDVLVEHRNDTKLKGENNRVGALGGFQRF